MRIFIILLLCFVMSACVSSGSYERLERQNKLLTIERDHLRRDKQQLQREAKGQAREQANIEQRLAERDGEVDELKRLLQTMGEAEKRAEASLDQLRELALAYKQWILTHGYHAKRGAQELLRRTDALLEPALEDGRLTH